MKFKSYLFASSAIFLLISASGSCLAEDQATSLAVNDIVLNIQNRGEENVTVWCNQACVPRLSALEGNKPRIIMDFANISYIAPKYRNFALSGKYVMKLRSNLDPASNTLRVVLDMVPSKRYIVHPTQDQTANAYSVIISQDRRKDGKYAKKLSGAADNKISIMEHKQSPIENDSKRAAAAEKSTLGRVAGTKVEKISIERGRSEMNAGNFSGAIATFTELIAQNPHESLPYRLRGNAYDNMSDRQRAVGDWCKAASLGDKIVQSYLDYLKINWKESPSP